MIPPTPLVLPPFSPLRKLTHARVLVVEKGQEHKNADEHGNRPKQPEHQRESHVKASRANRVPIASLLEYRAYVINRDVWVRSQRNVDQEAHLQKDRQELSELKTMSLNGPKSNWSRHQANAEDSHEVHRSYPTRNVQSKQT